MTSGIEEVASVVQGETGEIFIPEFGLLNLKGFDSSKKYEGRVFRLSADAMNNISQLMGFVAKFDFPTVRTAVMDLFRTEGTCVFEMERNTKPTDIALRFGRDRWVPKEDNVVNPQDANRPWVKAEFQAKFISETLLQTIAEQLRLAPNQASNFLMRINFKEKTFGLITEDKNVDHFPLSPFFSFTLPSEAMIAARAKEATVAPAQPSTGESPDTQTSAPALVEAQIPAAAQASPAAPAPAAPEAQAQLETATSVTPAAPAAGSTAGKADPQTAAPAADAAVAQTPAPEATAATSFESEVSRGSPFSQVRPTAPAPPPPAPEPAPAEPQPTASESRTEKVENMETPVIAPVTDAPPAVPNIPTGVVHSASTGEPQPGQTNDLAPAPAVSQMPAAATPGIGPFEDQADKPFAQRHPAVAKKPAKEQSSAPPVQQNRPNQGGQGSQVNQGVSVRSKEFNSEKRSQYSQSSSSGESQAKYATYSRSEIDSMFKAQTESITAALGSKISSQQRTFQEAVEKQEKSFSKLIDTFTAQVDTARTKLETTVNKAQETTRGDIETFKKDLSKELDQQRTAINKSVLPVAKFIDGANEKPPKVEKKQDAKTITMAPNPLMVNLLWANAALAVGAIAVMLMVLVPLGERLEKIELQMKESAKPADAATATPSTESK